LNVALLDYEQSLLDSMPAVSRMLSSQDGSYHAVRAEVFIWWNRFATSSQGMQLDDSEHRDFVGCFDRLLPLDCFEINFE
jgi:hypothetical protein